MLLGKSRRLDYLLHPGHPAVRSVQEYHVVQVVHVVPEFLLIPEDLVQYVHVIQVDHVVRGRQKDPEIQQNLRVRYIR